MKRASGGRKKLPWKLDNYNYRWSKTYASTDDCVQWFNAVISWYYCGIIVTLAILCLNFCVVLLLLPFSFSLFVRFFHFYLLSLLWSFLLFHIVVLRFAHRRAASSFDIFSKFMRVKVGKEVRKITMMVKIMLGLRKKLFRVRLPCGRSGKTHNNARWPCKRSTSSINMSVSLFVFSSSAW